MRVELRRWSVGEGWVSELSSLEQCDPVHVVFVFGSTTSVKDNNLIGQIRTRYPNAILFGCSTAGEICGIHVSDNTLVTTAVSFYHTSLSGAHLLLDEVQDSYTAGVRLAGMLDPQDLAHVLVLSDGLAVNGSDLVCGLKEHLPEKVTLTGGLAGDGTLFRETLVIWGDESRPRSVAVLGFYGTKIHTGYGSLGGWDPFGPVRLITRSRGNVLFELDGQSALALYKNYLGDHASGLPATGLLFPLSVKQRIEGTGVVRTILSVNEREESLAFAGDVPEGFYAQLMKANRDRLIDGAIGAARTSLQTLGFRTPQLGILISCVGRKLVLRQRIEEEIEGVQDVLGSTVPLTGFYSYGEISPLAAGTACELHNQTMTITTLFEE